MLRIVPHTVPRVGRSYEHFPGGFELHLLQSAGMRFFDRQDPRLSLLQHLRTSLPASPASPSSSLLLSSLELSDTQVYEP